MKIVVFCSYHIMSGKARETAMIHKSEYLLRTVPVVPRVMDRGTIKSLSLLSFPICGKGFFICRSVSKSPYNALWLNIKYY